MCKNKYYYTNLITTNKLLYYKQPIINIGDKIPDANLYQLDGKTVTTLYEQIGNNFDHLLVGAFSNS